MIHSACTTQPIKRSSTAAVWILILCLCLLTGIESAAAQSSVTFKVNLKPQLEDSVFIPDRDRIYVKGDIFPLTGSRKIYLKDEAPADSVYETTVNFSASATGRELNYTFFIALPDEVLEEQMARRVKIEAEEKELDALYFNSFAW